MRCGLARTDGAGITKQPSGRGLDNRAVCAVIASWPSREPSLPTVLALRRLPLDDFGASATPFEAAGLRIGAGADELRPGTAPAEEIGWTQVELTEAGRRGLAEWPQGLPR